MFIYIWIYTYIYIYIDFCPPHFWNDGYAPEYTYNEYSSHYLLTLMLLQTWIILFLLWNQKGDV